MSRDDYERIALAIEMLQRPKNQQSNREATIGVLRSILGDERPPAAPVEGREAPEGGCWVRCPRCDRIGPIRVNAGQPIGHCAQCWLGEAVRADFVVCPPPATAGEATYPCEDCGALRTKAEGGTTFTVCDECWDKHAAKGRR